MTQFDLCPADRATDPVTTPKQLHIFLRIMKKAEANGKLLLQVIAI